MSRVQRRKSVASIYHVIIRGINRQSIFEDEEDNKKFIEILKKYREVSNYDIYAYCLMGNHVHILIKENKEELGQIMRRICSSYVYWYNKKYERIGPLFQDRYKSEPVEDDGYLLTVIRYIYQNPVKAGIENKVEKYIWSDYKEYFEEDIQGGKEFVLNIFSMNRVDAIDEFEKHVNKDSDDVCLDVKDEVKMTDNRARDIIIKAFKIKAATDLQKFDKEKRNSALKELKEKYRLSIRQIERLTGINRGIVQKA